jgi:tetratricopeptide (TPR) repeat protein
LKKAENLSGSQSDNELMLQTILKAGEAHRYIIAVDAGEFVHIKALQNGIDVIAKVSDITNNWEGVFDSPTGELGSEDIYLLSHAKTKYEIEIYPAQKFADPGTYKIEIFQKRKASIADKKWMTALTATQNAAKLRSKNETRKQSIEQYKTALSLWKELKDDVQYASAMRSLGFVYIRENNYEKSLEIFHQLLSQWKQIGDVRAEGFTHLIIGRIYDLQKNFTKSLEYNLSSLPYWKTAKDTDQESFVLMNIGNLYADLNDKQKSIDFFEQALKINEQSKRASIKAVILRDYATAMLSVGAFEKAILLYGQSINQWQITVNKLEEAKTAVMLAAYFAEKNNKEKATQYYQHALEIWKTLDEQNEMKKIQSALDRLRK